MKKRRLLDTNLIIRHLVQDNVSQAQIAGKLFEMCDSGKITLVILPAVVAEAVFVLESFYNHSCHDIAKALGSLLASPGIKLEGEAIHQNALVEYAKGKQHFVDCLIVAYARDRDLSIATFDHEFKKLTNVRVELT